MLNGINERSTDIKKYYINNVKKELKKMVELIPLITLEKLNPETIKENSEIIDINHILKRELSYYKSFFEEANIKVELIIPKEKTLAYTFEPLISAVASTTLGDLANYCVPGTKENPTNAVVKLDQTKKEIIYSIANPFNPNISKNFPGQIGMGEGRGGKFLGDIMYAYKGTVVDKFKSGEIHLTEIIFPRKYIKKESLERIEKRKESLEAKIKSQ